MKPLRPALSLTLVAALVCFTTQSLDLHVHETDHASLEHQHGFALHQHDAQARMPSDDRRVRAAGPADTVIPISMSAASAATAKPVAAPSSGTPVAQAPIATLVNGARVIARAHGPPSHRPSSLRAPPRSASL